MTVLVMNVPVFDGALSELEKAKYPWGISFHIGRISPLGNFNHYFGPGYLAEVDIEYRFTKKVSLEGIVGLYTFDPKYEIKGGTLYLKGYLPLNSWSLFGALGAGLYKPENSDVAVGISVGAGINRSLFVSGRLHGDLGAYYFKIFSKGDDINFLSFKAGLRYYF